MHTRALIFVAIMFSSIAAQALPKALEAFIESQMPEFKKTIATLSPEQTRLVVDRYADLLMDAPFTLNLDFEREELLEYVSSKLQFKAKEESKEKPAFPATIEKDLASLIQSFKGEFRDGLLNLNARCGAENYELPFKIDIIGPVAFGMTLSGVAVPERIGPNFKGDNRCLELLFLAPSQPVTLERLATMDAACPIPSTRAGTCLLNVAQQIVQATKRKRMALTDGSRVKCTKNRERVSLWHLRIYQGRPSWYESNGFRNKDEDKHTAALEAARAYTLNRLLANLKQPGVAPSEKQGTQREILSKNLPEFEAMHKDATVAQFMSWLWENNCADYAEVDKLITFPGVGIEYAHIFPGISHLEKTLDF